MNRVIAALFLVVASGAVASAQAVLPSVWRSDRGALLKVLYGDPGFGNFSGVFLSTPSAPCPVVPYRAPRKIATSANLCESDL